MSSPDSTFSPPCFTGESTQPSVLVASIASASNAVCLSLMWFSCACWGGSHVEQRVHVDAIVVVPAHVEQLGRVGRRRLGLGVAEQALLHELVEVQEHLADRGRADPVLP